MESFPIFLGETFTAGLKGLPPSNCIKEISFSLRYNEEKFENFVQVNVYQHYLDVKTLLSDDLSFENSLQLEWSLPDDPNFNSQLNKRPPKYWELEVEAKTPGVDYHERFLVPVYAKS